MKFSDALKELERESKHENKTEQSNETDSNNEVKGNNSISPVCPISRQPIHHSIKLKCGHEFEYISLLTEYEITTSRLYIKPRHHCPYCRCEFEGFIPYYELPDTVEKYKIRDKFYNFRNNYLSCSHKLTTGKNKGTQCKNPGHLFGSDILCFSHNASKARRVHRAKQHTQEKDNESDGERCCQMLASGRRCKNRVSKSKVHINQAESSGLCTMHINKLHSDANVSDDVE